MRRLDLIIQPWRLVQLVVEMLMMQLTNNNAYDGGQFLTDFSADLVHACTNATKEIRGMVATRSDSTALAHSSQLLSIFGYDSGMWKSRGKDPFTGRKNAEVQVRLHPHMRRQKTSGRAQ